MCKKGAVSVLFVLLLVADCIQKEGGKTEEAIVYPDKKQEEAMQEALNYAIWYLAVEENSRSLTEEEQMDLKEYFKQTYKMCIQFSKNETAKENHLQMSQDLMRQRVVIKWKDLCIP